MCSCFLLNVLCAAVCHRMHRCVQPCRPSCFPLVQDVADACVAFVHLGYHHDSVLREAAIWSAASFESWPPTALTDLANAMLHKSDENWLSPGAKDPEFDREEYYGGLAQHVAGQLEEFEQGDLARMVRALIFAEVKDGEWDQGLITVNAMMTIVC